MNILHISTTLHRGAGVVAKASHELFLEMGYQSHIVVKKRGFLEDLLQQLANKRKQFISDHYWHKILKLLRKKNKQEDIYDGAFSDIRLPSIANEILNQTPFIPDIILLHWISGFINHKTIEELIQLTGAKVLWNMIDNAPITGGCHYPWQCIKYQKECGHCPALESLNENDISRKYFLEKQAILRKNNVGIIAYSKSDLERAKSSAIIHPSQVFHNLLFVDDNKFQPSTNIDSLKLKYNIPNNAKILLVGASNIQDKRKGFSIVLQALKKIKQDDIFILLVGKTESKILKEIKQNKISLGNISLNSLIECYQLADAFICSSVEDSGPYMINQSIMCGTPVIAFNIGVANDIVINNISGYNCGIPSTENMVLGINKFCSLSDKEINKLKKDTSKFAKEILSKTKYMQTMEAIFKNISLEIFGINT